MRDGFIVIDADGHAGDLESMYRQLRGDPVYQPCGNRLAAHRGGNHQRVYGFTADPAVFQTLALAGVA